MIDKTYLKSLKQTEVAALLDLSERRIQQLHGDGLPRNGSGRGGAYDWTKVRGWWETRISCSFAGGGAGVMSHGERLKKIQADDAELDLALKLKTLVRADLVREVYANELASMRARLLSIPATAAMRINDTHTQAQREAIIRKDIYEALTSLTGEILD
jgi:phage terminase Nu1 subunit (DNA packaging protein)